MIYQLITNSDCLKLIKDDNTICFIPNDLANRDWREYQLWLVEGNTPEPADE